MNWRTRLCLVAGLVGAVGCTELTPCQSNSDCRGLGVCDAKLKICYLPEEAGGDAATDAGGDGGIDGGVDAGPSIQSCVDQKCEEWQTCMPVLHSMGTCANIRIDPLAPNADETFGGTTNILFKFQVTQWDGGVWEGSKLPVLSSSGGISGDKNLEKNTDGDFVGVFTPANKHGPQSVTVGWEHLQSTITVKVEACDVSCAEWQECHPTTDGGTCVDQNLQLSVARPDGGTVGKNAGVEVQVKVVRPGGGAPPDSVPFRTANGLVGTLARTSEYKTTIDGGSTPGSVRLILGWEDGGPHLEDSYIVDATPPTLGLVVASDGHAYLRDAVIPAIVTSSEAISDAGLSLGGTPMAQIATSSCPGFGSTTGAVACFSLDFSQPAFSAVEGSLGVALSGTDMFGNSGSSDGGTLPVTRNSWKKDISPDLGGNSLRASPALGQDGTIYLGSITNGTLLAVTPQGNVKWDAGVGAVMSIAVGPTSASDPTEVVFYASNQAKAYFGARAVSDGSEFSSYALPSGTTTATYSGLGLVALASETASIGSLNSTSNSRLVRLGTASGGRAFEADGGILDVPAPGALASPANVLVNGTQALFLRQGSSAGVRMQPVSGLDDTPSFGTPTVVGNASSLSVAPGQAWLSDGTTAVFGVSGVNQGIYRYTGSLQGVGVGADFGAPSILSDTRGYIGAGNQLVSFAPNGSATNEVGSFNEALTTTPVLGAARPSSSKRLGYAVSSAGFLMVFDSVLGTKEWQSSGPLASGKTVAAHPTLDCSRTGSKTTGTLYVLYTDGTVQAIIVDSPGLDGDAVWPKYQRTAGNAGNRDPRFPIRTSNCP